MAKSPFEYNPERMEFRRKDRNTLAETEPSAFPAAPPVDPTLDNVTVASLVGKPEGYIDPTPTRRRRRSRSAVKRKAAGQKSTAWRGVMWVLILIMAVFWVYMLYHQTQGKSHRPEADVSLPLDRPAEVPGG